MRKKYFTEEEKKIARKLEAKKYYDKIKKKPLSTDEKVILKQEREKKRKTYCQDYYINNKEKIKKYDKEYFKNNKIEKQRKNNERYKKRKLNDPLFRLICNLKRSIRAAIKKNGLSRKSNTKTILGCDFNIFKLHLESKFESWMNWENYGLYNGRECFGWDIDHITPIATAKTLEEVEKLNNYINLQPLCSYVNRVIKRNNIITVEKTTNISKITIK